MPDPAVQYTLTSTGGTINFNDGTEDQFYITEIPTGLAGAPISLGVDAVAFGQGSNSYTAWQRGRQIQIEGVFLVTSTLNQASIQTIRNDMEEELLTVLNGCVNGGTGTLGYTPLGGSPVSLTVKNNVPLECVHDQNYLVRTFSFGLFSDLVVF